MCRVHHNGGDRNQDHQEARGKRPENLISVSDRSSQFKTETFAQFIQVY